MSSFGLLNFVPKHYVVCSLRFLSCSLVPKRYEPDLKLGTWVHTQRIQYRKLLSGNAKKGAPPDILEGEASEKSEEEKNFRLTEDRRRRLDEVGFVWSARESDKAIESVKVSRNSYDDQWDAMFERLKAYKDVHGVSWGHLNFFVVTLNDRIVSNSHLYHHTELSCP